MQYSPVSPLYLYRCDRGHEHEWLTRFGEKPPEQCPRCSRKVEHILATANLKADGAYSYKDGD